MTRFIAARAVDPRVLPLTTVAPLIPFNSIALGGVGRAELLEPVGDHVRYLVLDESPLDGAFDTMNATAPNIRASDLAAGPVPRLVVYPFELGARRVTLGRSRTRSDIVIRDRRLSGAHAAIAPGDGRDAWLIDLASSNGTFLESRCLAPGEAGRVLLRPGATFALAHVAIRFADHAQLREIAEDARR